MSPYVLAGEGSWIDACLILEATVVEGSWGASALPLLGVAGEPAISVLSMKAVEKSVTSVQSIETKEGG